MSEVVNKVIKAVLFDFGGVFTDSPFAAVHDFGEELGLTPQEITMIVFGSYEQDGDHPWHQLERGEIALEDARQAIIEKGRERDLEVDVYQMFAKMAEDNAGAGNRSLLFERVGELREQGYQLGIITNNVKEFGEGWRSLMPFPVEEMFHFVVDSCMVGVRKPDPRIYQFALDKLPGIDACEAVFLDDYLPNVEAAQALGMQALLVGDNPTETVRELDRLLV